MVSNARNGLRSSHWLGVALNFGVSRRRWQTDNRCWQRIDRHDIGRRFGSGGTVDEALWMAAVSVVKRCLLDRGDRLRASVEDVGRDMSVQSAVLMFVVVPVEEVAAPTAPMVAVVEARRVIGLGS